MKPMSTAARAGLVPLVLLSSFGCATTPPATPEPPFVVPSAWSATTTDSPSSSQPSSPADSLDPWWQSFGDPHLEAIIDQVLDSNQDLRQAAAVAEIAAAQARISSGELRPSVTTSLDAARRQQVFVGLPIPGNQGGVLTSRSDAFSSLLSVSWEADLWGRIRHRSAAAAELDSAARADLAAARLALVGHTAKSWFTVTELNRQRALAVETLASLTATRERVARRYRSGVAPAIELRLARTNEARAEALLARRQKQLRTAMAALEVLTGAPRLPLIEQALGETTTLFALPPSIPVGLPADLLARRPDLVGLEHRLRASGHGVASAHRALYPRLTLTAGGGTSSSALGDLLDGNFSVWSLAGGLLQPIFQGGRLRAAEDVALAERDRVLAMYVQRLLVALSEVETALASEALLVAEETALGRAVTEAEAATSQAESRYLAGIGAYLAVLESQRQWFAVRGEWLAVRRERLTTRIDLHLALGGDFAPRSYETDHIESAEDESRRIDSTARSTR